LRRDYKGEVLEKLFDSHFKQTNSILLIGCYLLSDCKESFLIKTKNNYFVEEKKYPIVSTEEFLRNIGKEELINYDAERVIAKDNEPKQYKGFATDPLLPILDEAGIWQGSKENYSKLWNDVVPKYQKDVKVQTENINYKETPLTPDECIKPEPNIFDRQQKLFNYLSNECSFTALQSQMQDIEDIVKEMIKPTEFKVSEYIMFNNEELFLRVHSGEITTHQLYLIILEKGFPEPTETVEYKKKYNNDLDYLLIPECNYLGFIYNTLLTVHCENPNIDYMLKLRDIVLKENAKIYDLEDMRKCFIDSQSHTFNPFNKKIAYKVFDEYIENFV
jgi:hypothetical protein